MAVLHLKAKPNARHTALLVAPDGTVTVRLAAPAQDGKANTCLLAYLAGVFDVAKSGITLLTGHTAPFKKIDIPGVTAEELDKILQRYVVG